MSDSEQYTTVEHPLYPGGIPTWRFSLWSVAAVVATGVGGLFGVVGQAANLLSRECEAMANWNRQNYGMKIARREWEAHQREEAEVLRRLVEGDAP